MLVVGRSSVSEMKTNPLLAAFFPFAHDGVWQQHVAWVDASNLIGGAAAICCLIGVRPLACGLLMLGDTLVDSYLLLWRIAMQVSTPRLPLPLTDRRHR